MLVQSLLIFKPVHLNRFGSTRASISNWFTTISRERTLTFSLPFSSPMNRARKLVASISTLSTRRRTYSPSSSTFRTISIINSQTHHSSRRESFQPSSSAKPLCLRFSGREFSSGSSDTTSSSVCWNCGSSSEKAAFLFCDSCRSIQPIDDSVDYFQIFDL